MMFTTTNRRQNMSFLQPFYQLGISPAELEHGDLCVYTPIDGSKLGQLTQQDAAHVASYRFNNQCGNVIAMLLK